MTGRKREMDLRIGRHVDFVGGKLSVFMHVHFHFLNEIGGKKYQL